MNLMNEDIKIKQEQKSKKVAKMLVTIIVILFILSIAIGGAIIYLQSKSFKFTVDGKVQSEYSNDLFVFDGNEVYIAIKDFAPLVGYKYHDGDYQQYSADKTKCYVDTTNELCSFAVNEKKIYKLQPNERDADYEYFELDKSVRLINNKLYVSAEGICIGLNVSLKYDKEKNRVDVYTLETLVNSYTSQLVDVKIDDNFNNKKSILYGMLVIENEERKVGVVSTEGEEILGNRYQNIKFMESSNEFIVTTTDNKLGIFDTEGNPKIRPEYSKLNVIDPELKLYLVQKDNKNGIVDDNGNIIAHIEYDEIGIKEDASYYRNNDIKNQYILFDNAIPVRRAEKWGLIDKSGKIILPIEYDRIGCIEGTSSNKAANNLLIIPDYEAIVVCKDKKYGLVNSLGKVLILCQLDAIYSVTNSGVNDYYMSYGNTTEDILAFLNENYGSRTSNDENKNEIIDNTTEENSVVSENVNNEENT